MEPTQPNWSRNRIISIALLWSLFMLSTTYCIFGQPHGMSRLFATLLSLFFVFWANVVIYTAIPERQVTIRRVGLIGLGLLGSGIAVISYNSIKLLYLRGFSG